MLRFEAAFLVLAVQRLKELADSAEKSGADDSTDDDKKLVNKILDEVSEHVHVLPSPREFQLKIHILRTKLAETVMTGQKLGALLLALHQDICTGLLRPAFLAIPQDKVQLFDQKEPPFGDDSVKMFPDAVGDIASASRCLALDEWTASVFHAMRVLEHALRRFAAEVGIPMSATYDQNWQNIIDQIESKIEKEQKDKRSATRTKRLKAYSRAAINFRYFKDAWRNHVTHSKDTYEEVEATAIYNHVCEFVQALARDLTPRPRS